MKSLVLKVGIATILFSCSQGAEKIVQKKIRKVNTAAMKKESVITPIKGLEIRPEVFTINSEKADTVHLSNGGQIVFPENAFVDASGQQVKGPVDIHWQEFHSLSEILFSGIPMTYDSAGVVSNFESGGMFTIDASQHGKEIELAPGKSASVSISSTNDQKDFNFYSLDEETGAWTYMSSDNGKPIRKEDNVEIVRENKDCSFIDVTMDLRKYPELVDKEIVAWKTTEKLAPKDERIIRQAADSLKLVNRGDGTYNLFAKTKKNSTSVVVEPYTLEDAEKESKAKEEAFQRQYLSTLEFREKFRKGEYLRTIEISGFGTYNWDCAHRWKNPETVIAQFHYPENVDPESVSVFFVSPEENIIVRCSPWQSSPLTFDPKKKVAMVAILPGNKLSLINNAAFQNARQQKTEGIMDLVFEDSDMKLYSPQDMNKYLKHLI